MLEGMAGARIDTVASVDASVLESEYRVLVEGCGVVDRSQRGKLALTGAGALEFLNGQVTNELLACAPAPAATRPS